MIRSADALRVAYLILAAARCTGCSVLGFAAGAAIDSGRPDVEVQGAEVLLAARDTKVSAALGDGHDVSGRFAGGVTATGESYAAVLAASCERLPGRLVPRPGEPVRLRGARWTDPPARPLTLAGLERHRLVLRTGENVWCVPWGTFDGLESDRGILGRGMLQDLVADGQLPVVEGILLQDDGSSTVVRFENARSFTVGRRRAAKWAGLFFGLLIDVALFVDAMKHIDYAGGISWE